MKITVSGPKYRLMTLDELLKLRPNKVRPLVPEVIPHLQYPVIVRLILTSPGREAAKPLYAHAWTKIIERKGKTFKGILAEIDRTGAHALFGLTLGDEIRFELKHVTDVHLSSGINVKDIFGS